MSDMLRLTQLLEQVREEARLRAQFEGEPQRGLNQRGFEDVLINLADARLGGDGGGYPLLSKGYEISFLRRGSVPGALLQILGGSGITQPFAPGDYLRGSFGSGDLQLKLATGSAAAGTAVLRVGLQPQVSFREAAQEVPVKPTALLGTLSPSGVPGFVTVTEDIVPSGAASGVTGAFTISGWRRILVLIDSQSGGVNATSFALNPFYQVPGGTLWFDQGGTETVIVGDSNPSGGQYRMAAINLSQAEGSLYLGIRNLLVAARTTLGLVVLGVG